MAGEPSSPVVVTFFGPMPPFFVEVALILASDALWTFFVLMGFPVEWSRATIPSH
jgi:hypothetical protein